MLLIGIVKITSIQIILLAILIGFNNVLMMEVITKMKTELDQIMMLEEALTEKQFKTLQDILYFYKDFEEELYNYPDPKTLFTETQREIFQLFDIQ